MSDMGPAGAVRLLLSEMEKVDRKAENYRHLHEAEVARLRRLASAADQAIATLEGEEKTALRHRLAMILDRRRQRHRVQRSQTIQVLLDYLALRPDGMVRTGEAQAFVENAGTGVRRGYAAEALRRLEELGVVKKLGRGLFRVNGAHELILGQLDMVRPDPDAAEPTAEAQMREEDRALQIARNRIMRRYGGK